MGRSKQSAPKRRRVQEANHDKKSDYIQEQNVVTKEQLEAIKFLQKCPQQFVEKAAADAIRDSLPHWETIFENNIEKKPIKTVPPSSASSTIISKAKKIISPQMHYCENFQGLGVHTEILSSDFIIFRTLHDTIVNKISLQHTMTSWSGSVDDPRRRAFGFLPNTLGYKKEIRSHHLDISTPIVRNNDTSNQEAEREKEIERNSLASVLLTEDDIPIGFSEALHRLLKHFKNGIHAQSKQTINKENTNSNENGREEIDLTEYLTLSNLIAAQPNLHCGRHLLPSHVDHPTKDGFGIIIITIAIRGGGAYILLESHDQKKRGKFRLEDGEAYMLSGFARDACTHGVLADGGIHIDSHADKTNTTSGNGIQTKEEDRSFRESLNLRFGLHGLTTRDPPPSQVLQYWGENFL